MLLATRVLRLEDRPGVEIPVRIFAPVQDDVDWTCRFEIGWPEGMLTRSVIGIDTIQALELALRMIGTILYSSDLHKSGRLMWQAPKQGYGFPVPNTIRDLLVGEDREFL
ncbi:MAG: hypothetical protein QOF91_986 [Alphaproteobacteria bacterium]|jgi:hypothetical protein|nr:hypothetical protein [Alphaproteobacteria bacterium]